MKKITSVQHPLVKHLVKLRTHRRYRYERKTVVVEGAKLITEIGSRQKIRNVLVMDESRVPDTVRAEDSYLVSREVIKKISGVQTPEGIVAEVSMPLESSLDRSRHLVILDGISDPGNLGTLLRTALAFGWDGAFILNNSCDPYNDKAIRAAKGATFQLPIRQGVWTELQVLLDTNDLQPVAADMQGQPFENISLRQGIALVLGSEARGLSAEAKECCQRITIPMSDKMESLNVAVAGGILMYFLGRQ